MDVGGRRRICKGIGVLRSGVEQSGSVWICAVRGGAGWGAGMARW
jgi:hypothetical protein